MPKNIKKTKAQMRTEIEVDLLAWGKLESRKTRALLVTIDKLYSLVSKSSSELGLKRRNIRIYEASKKIYKATTENELIEALKDLDFT